MARTVVKRAAMPVMTRSQWKRIISRERDSRWPNSTTGFYIIMREGARLTDQLGVIVIVWDGTGQDDGLSLLVRVAHRDGVLAPGIVARWPLSGHVRLIVQAGSQTLRKLSFELLKSPLHPLVHLHEIFKIVFIL